MRKTILNYLVIFLSLLPATVWAQTSVKGTVTDAKSSLPVPNASITIRSTNLGTSSDADGNFKIDAPKNAVLVITAVGYKTQEVSAASELKVQLIPSDALKLEEVVVVGFGSKIKKDLTGNIAKVRGADVQQMPVANLDQAIQGRAAGVFVESQSGKVGEGIKVLIRGSSSISASNDPL